MRRYVKEMPPFWHDELTCLLSEDRLAATKAYQAKYGHWPILIPTRNVPSWIPTLQKLLDYDIEHYFGCGKNTIPIYPMERLGYQISPQNCKIIPVVMRCLGPQKPWRRMRLFPQKDWFIDSPLITALDRRILSLASQTLAKTKYLRSHAVLPYLVKHPFVTIEDNPHTLITLQEVPFCLSMHEGKDGFIVTSNIDKAYGRTKEIFLIQASRTQWFFVPTNAANLHFLHQLRTMQPIPLQAKKLLLRLCNQLATHMQISAPNKTSLTKKESSAFPRPAINPKRTL